MVIINSVIWNRPFLHIFTKLVLNNNNVLLGIIHIPYETAISSTIFYGPNLINALEKIIPLKKLYQ